ncbi:MAG: hypothetical protein NW226_19905 [Microscillaceae bacterium]|nr:hypothetical protein [Microscillaceae bacterium]
MKNWSIELKKYLILKLTQSMDYSPKTDADFSDCFGAWEDDRNAEEIIREIRADSVNKSEIEEF